MSEQQKPSNRYGLAQAAQFVTVWSLAVAQPIYDLLTRNPEFLVVRGSSFGEVLLFAGSVSLLAPALLVGLVYLTGRFGRQPQWVAHYLIVSCLAAALVLSIAKKNYDLPATALLAGSLVLGGLIAWALQRWRPLRSWATLLAFSAIIFPLVFFWRVPPAARGSQAGAWAPHAPAPENPVPVVLVIFDQVPLVSLLRSDGEIDAKSFPNFAALARHATWYPHATTVHQFTIRAIPAMLTGRYPNPDRDEQPIVTDHPVNLFTLLGPHYEITAQESLTRLCPQAICETEDEPLGAGLRDLAADLAVVYLHILLPEAWSARLPPVDQTWKDFGGRDRFAGRFQQRDHWHQIHRDRQEVRENRANDFLRFLDRIRSADRASLYYYASFLPHPPHDYLPSGLLYSTESDLAGVARNGRWGDDEWAILQDQQRHLLQVGFADRLLGLLIQRLRDTGVYDSALLIVTSDHGVAFQPLEHQRSVTLASFAETLAIPLFVKLPGQQRGHRDARTAETIDVLPTILDVLAIPSSLEGASLLSSQPPGRQHHLTYTSRDRGQVERFSNRQLQKAIDEAIRRKVERFGNEGFSTRFFQVGKFGNLVGRPVSELGSVASSSFETELVFPADGAVFDRDQGMVPAHILGTSRPTPPGERPYLAIAINGKVQAVTRTWKASPKHREGDWSAVVDDAAFARGTNRIEVFHVEPTPGGARLARTDSAEVSVIGGPTS